MSLMSMLDRAQGGRLYAAVARSVDLDEAQTRKAMALLCPAIAQQLHAKAAKDEELFQSLLDLIADNGAGNPLDDETLEALRVLDDLLGRKLGSDLRTHITGAELAALRRRLSALLEDPVMPGPAGRRPLPWPAF